MKKVTLNLIDFRPFKDHPRFYTNGDACLKIDSITNSTRYVAGDFLPAAGADALIHSGWEVKIRRVKNSDLTYWQCPYCGSKRVDVKESRKCTGF